MAQMRRGRRVLGLAVGALAMVAAACGSNPSATLTASSGDSSTSPTSTSLSFKAKESLSVGDADNGTSASVSVGYRITVTLASTYWHFADPSTTQVLGAEGQPTYAPGGASCPKIPGTGCGTVVATFTALAPGDADLAADRTSCGEALRCSEAQAHWRFHVRVTGPAPAVPPVVVPTTAVLVTTPGVVRTTTTAVTNTSLVPPSTSTTVAIVGGTGVQGTVSFSPVCPVERMPPDPACAPRPGQAIIRLQRGDGSAVTKGISGLDGRFTVPVAPGSYTVIATVSTPGPVRGCQVEPPQVTVASGSYVTVSVSCDTGIR